LYLSTSVLKGEGEPILWTENGDIIGLKIQYDDKEVIRIGYDVIKEVTYLLNSGQPIENRHIPTVELHLWILRNILKKCTLLVEILPTPWSYNYMVALTHDVDYTSIREYGIGKSLLGFFYRSILLSFLEFILKKKSFTKLIKSWEFGFLYPFVKIGILEDRWTQFSNYMELEDKYGVKSSFYFIPFKGKPGITKEGKIDIKSRSAKYELSTKKEVLDKLVKAGWEIGLHGIDAWRDVKSAIDEKEKFNSIITQEKVGIRIHWLYFEEQSWSILDKADYLYDTTFGYNEDIGFRAGTLQVYKPANVNNIVELPLHIQDGSLLAEWHLHLPPQKAIARIKKILDTAKSFGGVITVLWHQISIGPPRLWKDVYEEIIKMALSHNAWLTKPIDIINWFQHRRSVEIKSVIYQNSNIIIKLNQLSEVSPLLQIRVYLNPKMVIRVNSEYKCGEDYIDIKVDKEELVISIKRE
jgi:peptidoglycan/xylan/chitin deacetylase (PgdA/CDA1 family)